MTPDLASTTTVGLSSIGDDIAFERPAGRPLRPDATDRYDQRLEIRVTTKPRLTLVLLLLAASVLPITATAQTAPDRDYWPTDGWMMATPESRGMDPGLLLEADRQARATLPDLSALLVVRDGYLVFEEYYNDHERDEPINVRSITKSVTGALVGIALAEGRLESLDQTIGELIPDRIPADADPRTPDITLRHLLTMTSGWDWDIYADYPTIIASDDWVDLTLSLPVVYEPGTVYAYNTGGSHLLSVIVEEATGRDPADYAEEKLFAPLGIEPGDWQRSPQGERVGGFGLELTARDLAKFGYLYLNNGEWDGEQIVPADYVEAATTYQSAGDSTGLAAYGYQWWVTTTYFAGYPAYFGLGYGSNFVYVVPALDLVVVAAVARRLPPEELRANRPLFENYIIPAVIPS